MSNDSPSAATDEADWLTDEVIAAVARHMNNDHAEDNAVICRGVGGRAEVTAARFVGMTTRACGFAITTPDGSSELEVPFANEVTERAEVRAEVAALYHRSAAMLGIAPRIEH